MKIYTHSDKVGNKYGVGVVLIGDKEQEYMCQYIETDSINEVGSTLIGIKRALQYVKSNKLLYCKFDKVELYNSLGDKNRGIIRNLKHNPTFKNLDYTTQQLDFNSKNEIDRYRLSMCRTKIQVQQRMYAAINYNRYKQI